MIAALRAAGPSARLLVALVLGAGVALLPPAPSPCSMVVGPPLGLALAWLVGAPLGRWVRLLAMVTVATAGLALPWWWAGALEQGLSVAARALLASSLVLALTVGIAAAELGPALAALRCPGLLAEAVSASVLQLGTLGEEGRRLLLARQLRGAGRFEVGVDLLAALLARSAGRAERIDLARRLRGADLEARASDVGLRLRDVPLAATGLGVLAILHFLPRACSPW